MALCEISSTCIFFNDQHDLAAATAAMMKARYCKNSNTDCARYLVFLALGRDAVPADLAPIDRMRALGLVREADHSPSLDEDPSA